MPKTVFLPNLITNATIVCPCCQRVEIAGERQFLKENNTKIFSLGRLISLTRVRQYQGRVLPENGVVQILPHSAWEQTILFLISCKTDRKKQ